MIFPSLKKNPFMKNHFYLFVCLCVFGAACTPKTAESQSEEPQEHHHHSTTEEVPADSKKSIPRETHAMVKGAHITIKYHSPGVRGRTIWGGLVPYGEVWVTGAHSATSFEIDKAFKVGEATTSKGNSVTDLMNISRVVKAETTLPAGKYALFTIPGQEEWTFIINKNWNQHLADDYSPADDLLRLQVPVESRKEIEERLSYEVEDTEQGAMLHISWEYVRISVPIQIKE
jgi:hypothetical protein